MRILFIDSTHPSLPEELTRLGHQCDLFHEHSIDWIVAELPHYDGVVIRSRIKFTKEIIDKGTKLKFIARVGAGMENIEVSYAESKGIKCLHAPEGNANAVAEHALGTLLALFRNICKADAEVRKGKWLREENRGVELDGKTIGIIGYGNMGKAFAKKAKGFEADLLVYDKYLKGIGDDRIKECELEELFEKADVVSLHLPLTNETNNMVNEEFINKFKKNIYIINTSRGKIVNTENLVSGLKSGKVLGACLDVLEYESISFENINSASLPPAFNYLSSSSKVVLSPHIAGWTHESNVKMAKILAEKISKIK